MATFHFLTGFLKDVVRDANEIKKAGVKCTDIVSRDICETDTGKTVLTCYDLTFEGNIFQIHKAKKIARSLKHEE